MQRRHALARTPCGRCQAPCDQVAHARHTTHSSSSRKRRGQKRGREGPGRQVPTSKKKRFNSHPPTHVHGMASPMNTKPKTQRLRKRHVRSAIIFILFSHFKQTKKGMHHLAGYRWKREHGYSTAAVPKPSIVRRARRLSSLSSAVRGNNVPTCRRRKPPFLTPAPLQAHSPSSYQQYIKTEDIYQKTKPMQPHTTPDTNKNSTHGHKHNYTTRKKETKHRPDGRYTTTTKMGCKKKTARLQYALTQNL